MRIGTSASFQGDVETWLAHLHLVEDLGYGVVGMGDSQSLFRNPYVALGVAARETTRPMLATTVANPVTQHPAVTAGAIATVDELSAGRAVLGIGRGFSAVSNIGERPATTRELAEYVRVLRTIMRGETVTYRGKDIHAAWIRRPVPVIVSAYGPTTMRMAGECADGVIVASAAHPEVLRRAIVRVRAGAADAGRAEGEVAIWVMVRLSIRETRAAAIDDVKGSLASAALNLPVDDPHLPDELRPAIAELRARYDERQHVVIGGPNSQLLDELGLSDYIADRFAVCGTVDDCRARLQAIADEGVDVLWFAGSGRDARATQERVAREVGVEFAPNR
jgi:5,10-methylenetetrahydromethanopterin reductase